MKKTYITIIVLFVLMIVWNWNVGAAQLSERSCANLAVISSEVVWAREVGADKELVRLSITDMSNDVQSAVVTIVLKTFENLWATSTNWRDVAQIVMQDCYMRRGFYPDSI